MPDSERFLDWPSVTQVFKLERSMTAMRTQRQTTDVRYGITSCASERADAQQMLQWTRQYWGIENGLHYRRDVTLREDATGMSNTKTAQMMATMNNFVIGLTQKLGYTNLAAARRQFEFELTRQLCTIF